jgi:hypothetical protein
MRVFVFLLLTALISSSCTREDEAPVFPSAPSIRLIQVQPKQAVAYKDSISFQIEYEDGDGDLGENTAGSENLFLKDTRTGASYTFRIRRLVPENSTVPVKGTLSFVLPFSILTDESSASQQVVFEIKVKDRAGNESNSISTEAITIMRE